MIVHFWKHFVLTGEARPRKGLTFGALFRKLWAHWYHFFVIFRSLGGLWERWGRILMSKSSLGHQRCPRRRHPRKFLHFLGPIWESFFNLFLILWGMFSSIVFYWVPGSIFHRFRSYFETLFWQVLTFVRTSGFSDILQPFHSKTCFSQVQRHQF
jgi:hypothetical protein